MRHWPSIVTTASNIGSWARDQVRSLRRISGRSCKTTCERILLLFPHSMISRITRATYDAMDLATLRSAEKWERTWKPPKVSFNLDTDSPKRSAIAIFLGSKTLTEVSSEQRRQSILSLQGYLGEKLVMAII